MEPKDGKVVAANLNDHAFVAHWRKMLQAANDHFKGVTWSLNSLYRVHSTYQNILQKYVGIDDPSPFKRCAAFAVAFMDDDNYPIYGEFEKHPYKGEISHIQKHTGAVLAYEYVRYCLDGATLNRIDGTTVVLGNPLLVSKHTFIDVVHAFSQLKSNGPAAFHMLSLLLEQLAYCVNESASYEREI